KKSKKYRILRGYCTIRCTASEQGTVPERLTRDEQVWTCAKKTSQQVTKAAAWMSTLSADDSKIDQWYLDSGATHYMTPPKDLLTNYQQSSNRRVTMANKSIEKVIGKGTAYLQLKVNCEKKHLIVNEVLHVPNLGVNLISQANNFYSESQSDLCYSRGPGREHVAWVLVTLGKSAALLRKVQEVCSAQELTSECAQRPGAPPYIARRGRRATAAAAAVVGSRCLSRGREVAPIPVRPRNGADPQSSAISIGYGPSESDIESYGVKLFFRSTIKKKKRITDLLFLITVMSSESKMATPSVFQFDGGNFQVWKFQMRSVLVANRLFEMVNGSKLRPPAGDKEEENWIQNDARATTILTCAMVPRQVENCLTCQSAKEIWDKMTMIYE
ncbi:unnamed protein product, partial [Trichogramma brassicae]